MKYEKIALGVVLLFAFTASAVADGKVFSATMTVTADDSSSKDFRIDEVSVENGTPLRGSANPDHRAVLLDKEDETIYETNISTRLEVFSPSGLKQVDERKVYLRLPYSYSAEMIEIQDIETGETVADTDLGNRLCVKDDTCSSYCAGKEIDPDCQEKVDSSLISSLIEAILGFLEDLT